MKRNLLGYRTLDLASSQDRLNIPNSPNVCYRRKDIKEVEVEIYGNIGYSDLTGYPVLEDMKVEYRGMDLYDLIPEEILDEWTTDIIQESGVKDVPVSQER